MKTKLCICCLLLCLVFCMTTPALAADLSYVTDDAGVLSAEEIAKLEEQAAGVAAEYNCGIYMVTLENYRNLADTPEDCARWLFTEYDLGEGSDRDGVLLLLSMAERDYYLFAEGVLSAAAFTSAAHDWVSDAFLDDFANNDWYAGFSDFIEESGWCLEQAAAGSPLGEGSDIMGSLLIVIGVPCLIALVVCLIFRYQMKTARKQTHAQAYMVDGSAKIQLQQDLYTHSTQTRRKIETSSNNGGSSGRSSSGSGGKF